MRGTRVVLFLTVAALAIGGAQNSNQVRMQVVDRNGAVVASGEGNGSSTLKVQRGYEKGDRVFVTGTNYLMVRFDQTLPETLVYVPQGKLEYTVPVGREGLEPLKAFSPESFGGSSHELSARVATKQDFAQYRNVALNPYDEQVQSSYFPHATSNSVYRNMPEFQERNAIDGEKRNEKHGVWPYQSWGPDRRDDLWWKIDFGRPVQIDKVVLVIRGEFPHDTYWKKARLEFSDGSRENIDITDSLAPQSFVFAKRMTAWVRITGLVAANDSAWPAFTEVEVWGRDPGVLAAAR